MNEMPFLFPFPMPMHHPPQQGLEQAPPRVRLAMGFLAFAAEKCSSKIAVSDVGFEQFDGQQLADEEAIVRVAACKLLQSYFAGELKPDHYEEQVIDRRAKGRGHVLRCISCGDDIRARKKCAICGGTGTILVWPATGPMEEPNA